MRRLYDVGDQRTRGHRALVPCRLHADVGLADQQLAPVRSADLEQGFQEFDGVVTTASRSPGTEIANTATFLIPLKSEAC